MSMDKDASLQARLQQSVGLLLWYYKTAFLAHIPK